MNTPCLDSGAAEGCYKAGDEAVEVLGRDVNMGRVVLWTYCHGRRSVCLRTLGKSTDVRRSNCDTRASEPAQRPFHR